MSNKITNSDTFDDNFTILPLKLKIQIDCESLIISLQAAPFKMKNMRILRFMYVLASPFLLQLLEALF